MRLSNYNLTQKPPVPGLAGVLLLLLVAILLQPSTDAVTRTTQISAPPDRIFPFIHDFRRS